jgi:hypothetical protein
MAGTIIRRTMIIMLTPIGRLMPLMIIPAMGIAVLVPLTLMAIPAVMMATRLMPLTVLAIPAIGIAGVMLPMMRLPIPAISIATRLMPLTVLAIPAMGQATGLLPLVRLTIPAISMGTRLRRGESLTIRLRGKRAIRSGLGAQGAQHDKQTHRQNNTPPSFRSHLSILLQKNFELFICCSCKKPSAFKG